MAIALDTTTHPTGIASGPHVFQSATKAPVITTPAFSTGGANRLLVLLYSGPASGGGTGGLASVTPSGGSFSTAFTKLVAKNGAINTNGSSEIWYAVNSTTLTSITVAVAVNPAVVGNFGTLSIIALTGTSLSAPTNFASTEDDAGTGPIAQLIAGTTLGSWVLGTAQDSAADTARTYLTNTTEIIGGADPGGDYDTNFFYNSPASPGGSLTLGTSSPVASYTIALVEITPAAVAPTFVALGSTQRLTPRHRGPFNPASRFRSVKAATNTGDNTAANTGYQFPLSVYNNGRYLQDATGRPFPIFGDSAWSSVHNLNIDGLTQLINDRITKGFTATLFEVIEHKYTTSKPPRNLAGTLPFLLRLDGATWTGSPNGTTTVSGTGSFNGTNNPGGISYPADPYANVNNESPDFTTINPLYWPNIDRWIALCASKGVACTIYPAYFGFAANDEGWNQEMVANDAITGAGGFTGQPFADPTKSKLWNYGAWLGDRFKNFGNIIWILGGDSGQNGTSGAGTYSTAQSNAVLHVYQGIKSITAAQSQLWCGHWGRNTLASDIINDSTNGPALAAAMTLQTTYPNSDTAQQNRAGYSALSKFQPTFDIEDTYEQDGTEPNRAEHYWEMLSGGCGYMWSPGIVGPGSFGYWTFPNGVLTLSTPGTLDMMRFNAFFQSIQWWRLVPSGLWGQKNLVTSGGGTASPQSTDYVSAAIIPDGTLMVAYVPPAHTGTITVDMSVMSGSTRAQWFDPTTGLFTPDSTGLANSGTHVFTTPGAHTDTFTDWVLVLDASPQVLSAGISNGPALRRSPNPVSRFKSSLATRIFLNGTSYVGNISESLSATTDSPTRSQITLRSMAESISIVTDAIARSAALVRLLSDTTASPTDTLARQTTVARPLSETMSVASDTPNRATTVQRSPTETTGSPTDATIRVFGPQRSLTETTSVPTDTSVRVFSGSRSPSESTTNPTDAIARVFAGTRSPNEALAIPTDTVARSLATSRSENESLSTPTDTATRIFGAVRSPVEAIAAALDAIVRAFTGTRGPTESVPAPTDTVSKSNLVSKNISETTSAPTDTTVRVFSGARPIGESTNSPADVPSRSFSGTRSNSESIPVPTDSVSKSNLVSKNISETTTAPTDSIARSFAGARPVGESTLAPTDSLNRVFSGARGASESTPAPTDTVSKSNPISRTVTESQTAPTDSATRIFSGTRSPTETTSAPSDSPTRLFSGSRSASETLSAVTDSVSRTRTAVRALSETVAVITDAITRLFSGSRGPAESTQTPTDSVTGSKNGGATGFSRALSEALGAPVDVASRLLATLRAIAESAPVPTDNLTRTAQFGRGSAETTPQPSDAATRSITVTRNPNESTPTPTDLTARSTAVVRSSSETAPVPTDSLVRQLGSTRSVSESVPAPADSVSKSRVFAQSILETIVAAVDSVVRSWTGSRNPSESTNTPTDTVVGFVPRTGIPPISVKRIQAFPEMTVNLTVTIPDD